jgi:hypothetical protein
VTLKSDLSIAVLGEQPHDETRSLRTWMLEEPALHGRVTLRVAPSASGTLGDAMETLVVALGPGGIATALASVLVTWIRRRTTDITVKITKSDGSTLEVSGRHVGRLDSDGMRGLTTELAKAIDVAE